MRRRSRHGELLGLVLQLLVIGAFIVAPFAAIAGVDYLGCKSRWAQSALPTSWGPIQGCLVQLRDGRLVPESIVRETDIRP